MATTNMADEECVSDHLKQNGVVRECDVNELYLVERNLKSVDTLNKFRNLQRVWLNGNKLRKIDCLQDNFRLTEVYLQDNLLVDITGSLRHLSGLEVLMLQGNQLRQLTNVVHELRRMQRLRVLNLFGNPLAQDYDYRNYVIHNIKSLKLLDRREILKDERVKAEKKYGDAAERVKESVAFGRRVPATTNSDFISSDLGAKSANWENPLLDSNLNTSYARTCKGVSGTKGTRFQREENVEPEGTVRRSLMKYSTFDWSGVPMSEERRLNQETTFPAKVVTMYLR